MKRKQNVLVIEICCTYRYFYLAVNNLAVNLERLIEDCSDGTVRRFGSDSRFVVVSIILTDSPYKKSRCC